jgi:HTH domain
MVTLVTDATSRDPADGLAAVAALGGLLEALEALQVERARRSGWSWEAIAKKLGVSRQAVHQKHADVDKRKQRIAKRAGR